MRLGQSLVTVKKRQRTFNSIVHARFNVRFTYVVEPNPVMGAREGTVTKTLSINNKMEYLRMHKLVS